MCGIGGVFHFATEEPVSLPVLEEMSAVQRHRGPDGSDIHVEGRVGLANRRLAIVDVAGGRQPIGNEDGTVWMVANGEIYNFRALRDRLRDAGATFTSASDTEVLVRAYEQWGTAAVAQIEAQVNDLAATIYKDARNDVGVLPAERVLEMGTIRGAGALLLDRQIGSIEVRPFFRISPKRHLDIFTRQRRVAIQIVCRFPPAVPRARTPTSSTLKPTRDKRLVKAMSGPADHTANTPAVLSAA